MMFASFVLELTELELDLNRCVLASTVPHAEAETETVAPVLGVQESLAKLQRGEAACARGDIVGKTRTVANASAKNIGDVDRIFPQALIEWFGFKHFRNEVSRVGDG
jgi:hypothetical protein